MNTIAKMYIKKTNKKSSDFSWAHFSKISREILEFFERNSLWHVNAMLNKFLVSIFAGTAAAVDEIETETVDGI